MLGFGGWALLIGIGLLALIAYIVLKKYELL